MPEGGHSRTDTWQTDSAIENRNMERVFVHGEAPGTCRGGPPQVPLYNNIIISILHICTYLPLHTRKCTLQFKLN
ncbi:UNVERIFIED_CONTAM: hypothetical protein PYX00_001082 [Menopon gallinae]|uniref:Uncharacterized protein n=1 Tax=Menopon gallinae TaxID=328185 RepID=A0AAW2IBH1_9NEOP